MDGFDARVMRISPDRSLRALLVTLGVLSWSGFRRYATYRQATIAGAFTNVVFGFLRCYVLLAVAAAVPGGQAAGYGREQLATYVWLGQGLLSVVALWGWTELADRIRTGDVSADLLRPVNPVLGYFAPDLGRAGYAMITRFLPPLIIGGLVFPLYTPGRWFTLPLFAASIGLAVVSCFACRYLINATAYWLQDIRGPIMLWTLAAGVLAGLYFPLRLLPDWLVVTLYAATPFPGLLQIPLDVVVERDPPPLQAGLVGVQAVWAAITFALATLVQRRAERKLVVQGG